MKTFWTVVTSLLVSACASTPPQRFMLFGSQCERVEELYAAEDWQQLSEYGAWLLREVDFETHGHTDERRVAWTIVEACERAGATDTHALALRTLARLADPDAPVALLEFARVHGREPLARCGALERTEVATWLAMEADCQRGDWVAARERIAANFPDQDGAPHVLAIASHVLLGDLLRRADRSEPALVEYATAAFGRAAAGDPLGYIAVTERTLGCVRLESLLFEMGEGEWALKAMELVNQHKASLVHSPRSRALDQAVRDGANAEAALMNDIIFNYDIPAAPTLPALAQDLAALKVFDAPRVEGKETTWNAPSLGLVLVATDEVLRVKSTRPSVGSYEVAWTTETWHPGPKSTVYTEPVNAKGRCVRRFRDGSIYFGSSGFDSEGLLLRRGREPYEGLGLFGRPPEEAVQLVRFRKNEPAAGPTIEGLGERRSFVAYVNCGAFLIGEGYVDGDKLVPDGVVRLAYSSDDWFRTRFALGSAAPWRISGNVIKRSDLSRVEELSGRQVAWVDPEQWGTRIAKAKELQALAEREQFESQFRSQMETWASQGEGYYHGTESTGEVGGYPCYTCNGVGSVYGSGGWENYTYYEQSDPSSLPSPRTGTRWVNGARETCSRCNGTGKQ